MNKKYLWLLGFGLCVACAGPTEQNYTRQVRSWIGKTPEELITAWGQPTQVFEQDNRQYYIYRTERDIPIAGTQDWYNDQIPGYISPIFGAPVYEMQLFCETTFVADNGRITDFAFAGDNCKSY